MSRRGEVVVWAVWLVVTLAWGALSRLGSVPLFVPLFWGVLTLMAGGTSLGNWMDRHTVLRLSAEGVFFRNGLRTVDLPWENVERVDLLPSKWGQVIHVSGTNAHFRLRTLANIQALGSETISTQVGFPDGEHILTEIRQRAGLQVFKQLENGRWYYARQ
ncbi:MAG: hypothetical protein Fur0018_21450 [Anaerolineales bacterium]